jgi:hypothetical protein
MKTNVRTFLREFTTFKAKALRGETVQIEDREGKFLFTAVVVRKTLLGGMLRKDQDSWGYRRSDS